MKASFEFDMNEFEKALEQARLKPQDVRDGLEAGYRVFEGQAKVLIQTSPASGRQYGKHKASAPGEPPASDTGALAGNWPEPEIKIGPTKASIEGGPGQEYAAPLEFGTEKMAPRPFIRPALYDNEKSIWEAVKAVLFGAIKRRVG